MKMKITKGIKRIVGGCLILGLSSAVMAETLSFGVVPQQSAAKLAALWSPVLSYLSEKTDITLSFETATDIPTFERRLLQGQYDVAYMNPYHFTFFNKHRGYQALAHRDDKKIQGLIVVPKSSDITSLEQLDGQEIAFPSPAAFAASLLPRGELKKMGISITPKYVSSHDSVYQTVAKGFFVAGGGIGRTFNNVRPDIKEELKVLWKTEPYTPHAFAAHPRINEDKRQRLAKALGDMANDPLGAELLNTLSIKSLREAQNSDWDDVRSLDLKLLDVFIE